MRRAFSVAMSAFCGSILLVGCGNGESISCQERSFGVFGICVPSGWNELSAEELREHGVPQEVMVVFQSQQIGGNIPTVLITQEMLVNDFDASSYSAENVESVKSLPEFEQLDKQNINIDGENIHLHVFAAQPAADEPKKRFYQVSSVSKGVGYTATAIVPLSIETGVEEEVLTMLLSLTFDMEK
ncbi:hypothetical protein A3D11_00885 [Candidatus Peribacteria bacterium RIFCSPHIGHO2_02_FULL_49_16]|nr:MAG: hypothetical protein A2880_01250 [Candidatus Peribacteria bacterium RIFCSPHIGHO2_01_FULL_49_38]OGJ60080.1 MAG: hypothetical protein A3D11_00885 [Candidatus Peribacteria bacterium RIFCSPHIGHO2_02_FULL_49_16]